MKHHRKGHKKNSSSGSNVRINSPKLRISSPHMKIRNSHMKIRSPHMNIRSPHIKISSPHFKGSRRHRSRSHSPKKQLYVDQRYSAVGQHEIALVPGANVKYPFQIQFCETSNVMLHSIVGVLIDIGTSNVQMNQTSPSQSGIPEIQIEWFRDNVSITNGKRILYATDNKQPETIWLSLPFNTTDVNIPPGNYNYLVEVTNNSTNCIVYINFHNVTAEVSKACPFNYNS